MKTVLAALTISLLTAAPAFASGTPDVIRGARKPAAVQMAAAANMAPESVVQAAPTKKIRGVLASPYGNLGWLGCSQCRRVTGSDYGASRPLAAAITP